MTNEIVRTIRRIGNRNTGKIIKANTCDKVHGKWKKVQRISEVDIYRQSEREREKRQTVKYEPKKKNIT